MNWLLAVVTLVLGCGGPIGTEGPLLTPARTIPLAGVRGRIDHLAFDAKSGRLFVAALGNGSLEVIDLEKGERVRSIGGLKEPQGVACVPGAGVVIAACGGDGTVRAFDATTLEERGKAEVGEDADNVRVGIDGANVIVGYGDGALVVLDATTLKARGSVKLTGHPESFQVVPDSGRVFVNVPGGVIGGGGQVAVVDLASSKVTSTWALQGAGRNFPMALDAAHARLFVGCRRAARLVVLDTRTGSVVASPECVGDADDVFVDARSGRVLVVGGDGAVDVFETQDQMAYVRAASVKTAPGARTGLLVAERRALYVAVPERGGQGAEIREYLLDD